MKKTFLVGILTLSLILSFTMTAVAAESSPSSWATAGVLEAISLNLVPERLQSDYTSNITREEYCELVVYTMAAQEGKSTERFMSLYAVDNWFPFADCDEFHVIVARNRDVVRGVSETHFSPSALITRQEAAVMAANVMASQADEHARYYAPDGSHLRRQATYNKADASVFTDASKFADWSAGAINYVSAMGIMQGTGNNEFTPLANYTREQAILTMLRLYNTYMEDPTFLKAGDTAYTLPGGSDGEVIANPIETPDMNIK